MKKILLLALIGIVASCSKEQHDLTVKGTVKDLKKGTLYLQKMQDSILINVDSLVISGQAEFELHSDLESPEVFFLHLNKTNEDSDRKIVFFADKGITEIHTSLKDFAFNAKINGSEQQKKLEEYLKMMERFNDKNLDLIKNEFDAKAANDSILLEENQKDFENLVKSKYLYTVNFAVTNNDSEVAPYLALTEIYDAQIKWLDTINNALTPKIKNSKYGKELESFIAKRKAE
ncbi:hypothetical protein C1T31_04905 [Hanstruepera neustonica]|uniref:DUF4369 domain-containing protein n=1 Tax=Hanstruepera neustonica TaxID=1445657 RepID=A0A2K1E0A2_9FLAO|nr:DUF4369 domain-containing protein [Hanstruepera neustonica]PNQ73681.1 hypothetical protein C1T31_04905 [Hanstruepera neustonica]